MCCGWIRCDSGPAGPMARMILRGATEHTALRGLRLKGPGDGIDIGPLGGPSGEMILTPVILGLSVPGTASA